MDAVVNLRVVTYWTTVMPMPSVRPTPETPVATCVDVTQATQAMVKSAYVEVNNTFIYLFYLFI